MRLVGFVPGGATSVATTENLVLVGAGAVLLVFEKTPAGGLEERGRLLLPGIIADIVVREGVAFVAASSEVTVVEVVGSPRRLGVLQVDGRNQIRLEVDGDRLYVITRRDHDGVLRIYDLVQTGMPQPIAAHRSSAWFSRDIDYNRMLFAAGGSLLLQSGSQELLGRVDGVNYGGLPRRIELSEQHAVTTDGLQVFDLADPRSPSPIADLADIGLPYRAEVRPGLHPLARRFAVEIQDLRTAALVALHAREGVPGVRLADAAAAPPR